MEDHPLLRDAYQRRVAPLPPGELVGDSFAPLPDDIFADGQLWRLVRWYRCHLGVRYPLLCDTEADLLLVLAAGIYATKIPPADLRTTRRRAFAYTISRQAWGRCCRFLPQAEAILEKLLAAHPLALAHPEGLGPRAHEVHPTEVT